MASKHYKDILDDSYKQYRRDISKKLKTIRTKNTKDYWKILNSSDSRSKNSADINDMFDFFRKINNPYEPHRDFHHTIVDNNTDDDYNELLDCPITDDEIKTAVSKLKNNKAPALDNILNEHIKSSVSILLPLYEKLFNIVFDSGMVPEDWLLGVIKPIYKNKGDPTNPENYRPITLISCLGKLFTGILRNRLEIYAQDISLLKENQTGFRKGFSTLDNILTLQFLSQSLLSNRKKLFCAFIDFKQAFDTVWRDGLWYKLIKSGINGKCFNYIRNMYKGIKSLISMNSRTTEFFNCNVGVRQGENLSPFLFSLFINDVEDFLIEKNVTGLSTIEKGVEDELFVFLKLFILLYADDTVIMAESATDLQYALDSFFIYCTQWNLTVNVNKTKILVFSKGPAPKISFKYNNNVIEIVKDFNYLGIIFSRSGSFCKAKKHLATQAQKAMYGVIKKIRLYDLSIECQLDLFDKIVVPVLLYACEIWGYENIDIIERVHLRFLKHILNLKNSTPSFMVYGETGRYPLYVTVYTRMISHWAKVLASDECRICKIVYRYLYEQHKKGICNPWFTCIQNIFNSCGMSNIWNDQCTTYVSPRWVSSVISQSLKDQFIQKWHSDLNESSKGLCYRIYKTTFSIESYLVNLPRKFRTSLIKFRTTNHHFPVEKGRWNGTPRNERLCHFCNSNKIGDEFHYLMECDSFKEQRKIFSHENNFFIRPNTLKFNNLMSSTNYSLQKKLSIFISKVFNFVNSQTVPH